MDLSPTPKFATVASQKVWEEYLKTIDEARALVLNSRWAEDPVACAQAQYLIQMLQAFGFSVYMAPRQRLDLRPVPAEQRGHRWATWKPRRA